MYTQKHNKECVEIAVGFWFFVAPTEPTPLGRVASDKSAPVHPFLASPSLDPSLFMSHAFSVYFHPSSFLPLHVLMILEIPSECNKLSQRVRVRADPGSQTSFLCLKQPKSPIDIGRHFNVIISNADGIWHHLLWPPFVIGQAIIIFSCGFFPSFFFPRLISAAADWMSNIFPHMVWR